jgi:bifunctional DNA-binding transcriptional regulator/antitoxin component of YhaV-PrlF toxin-antitoxin module
VTKITNSNVRYEVITQEDSEGDIIIPLPMPLLTSLGWKEGDDLTISIDDEGKIYLKKAD